MGSAYTPGLTISSHTRIERVRRLPIKGEILVSIGDQVFPDTNVARAQLPGLMQMVRVSNILGIEPEDLSSALRVNVGESVTSGQLLAQSKGLFGLFSTEVKSPVDGIVETVSNISGNMGIRQASIPIDLKAYIKGTVTEIQPGEGVTVSTSGALIQGIFGFGGEKSGEVVVVSKTSDSMLTASEIDRSMAGKIIVGGSNLTGDALIKANEIGVAGVITGALIDKDMVEFLGYDIGVAITGHEKINTTVLITEGFGTIPMAHQTFDLLKSVEGKVGSINGATQIRAGVIRPELIVPDNRADIDIIADDSFILEVGTSIRIIREPFFGELATVSSLPTELTNVESGASVRVLEAKLVSGEKVVVPRANVEIMAG
jgi:hypothetical protein